MKGVCIGIVGLAFLASASQASVTMVVDVWQPGDEKPPPWLGYALAIDVLVDVTDGDSWNVGGIRGEAFNGAYLRYATDPNTGQIRLTSPGTNNRLATFFSESRLRDSNRRFTDGGASGLGAFCPAAEEPIATATEINVAWTADPPETEGSPTVDGAVFRVALDVSQTGRYPAEMHLFMGDEPPAGSTVYFQSFCNSDEMPGTVNATFDAPALTGANWGVYYIPETGSLALLFLAAAGACCCPRGTNDAG